MLGETVENVLRYLDDCINGGTSTEEISSPSFEEYSSETEETSGDESSNLSLELLKTKNWMLQQTKDQLLKAIAYHEKQNRLTLSKERLEAEKLLLITGKSYASYWLVFTFSLQTRNYNLFLANLKNLHVLKMKAGFAQETSKFPICRCFLKGPKINILYV